VRLKSVLLLPCYCRAACKLTLTHSALLLLLLLLLRLLVCLLS
jgi:hypothetical protein